jgi:hypothetical protein
MADLVDEEEVEAGMEEKMYFSNKRELLSVVPSAELSILVSESFIVLFPDANERAFYAFSQGFKDADLGI